MEGEIQIGDTFRKPKFRQGNRLQTFDRIVANPMWNQTEFKANSMMRIMLTLRSMM
jgi:type I restriction enzyme M protein